MKKGVVMVMALALIMILTLVILRSTTTTEKYLNDMSSTIYKAQFNRTFLDIVDIVQKATKEIKDANMFNSLLQIPLVISDDKSMLEGVMRMNSASGKFNINNLINNDANKTVNQTFYDLVYSFIRDYQITDGLLFLSMVLDTIDKDDKERAFGSELAYKDDAKISDGGIPNKAAFDIIIDTYSKTANDGNIYKIPWENFITFSGTKVDYNYINAKIKALLERDYGINTPYDDSLVKNNEDLSINNEQNATLKSLNIIYYVPRLACNFEFFYLEKQMSIDFIYDLESRRISNIETRF